MSSPESAVAATAQEAPAQPSSGHGRLIASIVLLAVALVATPLFIVAGWVNQEITNTDRYVDTVAPMADDPQVQQYVAGQLADAITSNVDLGAAVGNVLPPSLAPLQGTINSAVNGFVNAAANRFTASPAFKTIWVDANRAAHKTIAKVLTGDRAALDLSNGQLTLDVGDALSQLQQRLVSDGLDIAGKIDLSGVDRQIVLADGPRLAKIEQARKLVGQLEDLVWVLGIVALLAAVGSIVVAPRKGSALKRLGVGLALVVVVIAIVVGLTRRQFLSASGDTVPSGVIASFFDALVNSIRFAFRLVFVLGVVMAALVAIVSLPSYAARWARPTQIGVAILGVGAVMAAHDPTWGTVIAVVLFVAVVEAILEIARRRGLEAASRPKLTVAS